MNYSVEVEDLPVTVRAELLYQSVSFPFLEEERQYDDEYVREFLEEFDEVNKTTLVTYDEVSVEP